jgi:hypothetical protein
MVFKKKSYDDDMEFDDYGDDEVRRAPRPAWAVDPALMPLFVDMKLATDSVLSMNDISRAFNRGNIYFYRC